MIRAYYGDPVTPLRLATLDDVRTLAQREPTDDDRAAVAARDYIVVLHEGRERIYPRRMLREDVAGELDSAIEGGA